MVLRGKGMENRQRWWWIVKGSEEKNIEDKRNYKKYDTK